MHLDSEKQELIQKKPDCSRQGSSCLEIFTLGRFVVRHQDMVLTEQAMRKKKLWSLFTYFLRNEDKPIPSETIIDALWPEGENADPRGALHDVVYRLRNLFRKLPSDDLIELESSQSSYRFKLPDESWWDADVFVELSQRAQAQHENESGAAIDTYREALSIYEGHYLPEWPHASWVVPNRQYYRRVYVSNLLGLVELLSGFSRYDEIVEMCEETFMVDSLLETEELHCYYMEALAKQGQVKDALQHYKWISERLRGEYEVEPSDSLQNMYELIKTDREAVESENLDMDVASVQNRLKDPGDIQEAFLCDREGFRNLYELELRRSERAAYDAFLAIFTITESGGQPPKRHPLNGAMTVLKEVLVTNLRKGDAVCRWNEAQFLVLLPGSGPEDAASCLSRIENEFSRLGEQFDVVLMSAFDSVQLPSEELP